MFLNFSFFSYLSFDYMEWGYWSNYFINSKYDAKLIVVVLDGGVYKQSMQG